VPRWLTWCSANDLATINSLDKIETSCIDFKNPKTTKDENRGTQILRRDDPFSGLRSVRKEGRSAGEPINLTVETIFESSHFSAATVRGLLKFMRDYCPSFQQLNQFRACVTQDAAPPIPQSSPKTKPLPSEMTLPEQWTQRLNEALPQAAIVVKAQWMLIRPEQGNSPQTFQMAGTWNGLQSISSSSGIVSIRAKSSPNFTAIPNLQHSPLALPPRGKYCPGESVNSQAQPSGDIPAHLSISQMFSFQFCGNEQPAGVIQLLHGDYLALRALHIMTNSNPTGQWTWTTHHWHRPDLKIKDPSEFYATDHRRAKILSVRPDSLKGWQANYHMDLQYVPPDALVAEQQVKETVKSIQGYLNVYNQVEDAKTFCGVDPDHVPGGVFNPFIEINMDCGVFSNCMGCHSHAATGSNPNAKLRKLPTKEQKKDKVMTHFLWSLSRSFGLR
jgi:hypothetical protein